MRDYTLLIAFLLAPFLILSTGYIWTGQQIGLMVIFLILIASMIDNLWIRGFLLYVIAWQTFLFVQALMEPQMFQQAISSGYTQTLFMASGAVIYLTVSKSTIRLPIFYNAICVAALIQAGVALLQTFGVDLVSMCLSLIVPTRSALGPAPLVGFLGNPNYLAAFLAFSTPFFFRKRWVWSLPLVIYVLVASWTSSAVIPAIIAAAYFLWIELVNVDDRAYVGGIAALAIAGYLYLDAGSVTAGGRFEIWETAFNQVVQSPLGLTFGLGPGATWARNYPLHSEWVAMIHQFGAIGLSLGAGYVLTVKRDNIYLFSSFVIIVINMFGNSALHIAPTAFLACMVAGLMERETRCGN